MTSVATSKKVISLALVAAASAAFLAGFACSAPGFHVNPTLAPVPVRDIGPVPTAEVLRSVPFEISQAQVRARVVRPAPTPQFRYLRVSTAVPPPVPDIKINNGVETLEFTYPLGRGTPGGSFMRLFTDLEQEGAFSVTGFFFLPEGTGGRPVKVDGEYEVNEYEYDSPTLGTVSVMEPDFHLRYSKPQASQGAGQPSESEIIAEQGRIVTDTTANDLKTYPAYADWRNDPDTFRPKPGAAMFISLALTEGRVFKDSFLGWLYWVAMGNVELVVEEGPDGEPALVYQVSGEFQGGDPASRYQSWRVRVDEDGRPAHVEFSIDTLDPDKRVRGAVLDITYAEDPVR